MLTLRYRKIQDQLLDQAIEQTSEICRSRQETAALKGIRTEYSAGVERQLDSLIKIRKRLFRSRSPLEKLRDAYSLYPANEHLRDAMRCWMRDTQGEDGATLHSAIYNKTVVLHVSCRERIPLAQKSVESFATGHQDEAHIIVHGRSTPWWGKMREFWFEPNTSVLQLPVSDHYEDLHQKTIYAMALMSMVGPPIQVIKLDDDIQLNKRKTFNEWLNSLAEADSQYMGRMIRSHHQGLLHGWHIGKCDDAKHYDKGYQYPIAPHYAAGGSGYLVGRKGLGALEYSYLSMRCFLEMPVVGIEDGLVGLFMQLAGIELKEAVDPVTQCLPGLSTAE